MKRTGAVGWFMHDVKNRGITAWCLSAVFAAFYIGLYFSYTQEVKTFTARPIGELPGDWRLFGTLLAAGFIGSAGYLFMRARKETLSIGTIVRGLIGVPIVFGIFYLVLHGTGPFLQWSQSILVSLFTAWFGPKGAELVSQWTVYGLLYSIAIVGGGIYVIAKYRHNPYQIVRTSVVMLVQVTLAFSIPLWLKFIDKPDYYFSYIWPLKIDALYPDTMQWHASKSIVFVIYSVFAAFLLVPLMAIFVGKRWYCSWVCGCGGLANTFGEPWRHLSSKSSNSWKLEKVTIHAVLIAAIVTTALVLLSYLFKESQPALAEWGNWLRGWYGFLVAAILSGVVGVGVYPIGGTRIWCRFACPLAAILGLTQKLGRYRIRVKSDMCISCGLCSKYCEMGIDVRSYAQSNQSFTRASCVGCGLCAEVCPRGVLRLENIMRRDPQELVQIGGVEERWKGPMSTIPARL